MQVHIRAAIRADRVKKNGEANIVLRVVLGRKVVHTERTGRMIAPEFWDPERREVRKGHKNAKLYNLAIAGRISELEAQVLRAELQGAKLTPQTVKRIVTGKQAGIDFFDYCMGYIPVKYCEPRQKETRRSYAGEITKLKIFRPQLDFFDIDQRFLTEYRAYMITVLGNHENTVWKSLKFIKTMVNAAIREGKFSGQNPFVTFKVGSYKQGVRDYLEMEDCLQIQRVLDSPIPETLRAVGYYYLFMCYSGLRFSDALRFNPAVHIVNDDICMVTQKKQVPVTIYIHNRLREVINYIGMHPLKMSNKEFNKYLKVLGTLAGLTVNLTAHVGRHTFGAMLAEFETPKEVAQKLLGHSDSRSTSVYYHLKDKSIRRAMERWDDL